MCLRGKGFEGGYDFTRLMTASYDGPS